VIIGAPARVLQHTIRRDDLDELRVRGRLVAADVRMAAAGQLAEALLDRLQRGAGLNTQDLVMGPLHNLPAARSRRRSPPARRSRARTASAAQTAGAPAVARPNG